MVVQSRPDVADKLELAYISFFLGLRVNELVMQGMAACGFKKVRESHGYVVQHLIESDRSITELAKRMGVSQQAASKTVAELVKIGIVESAPAPNDDRAKRIRLSRRGWKCVRLGRQIRKRIDNRIRNVVGKAGYEQARSTLLTCLKALGGFKRIRSRQVRQPD